MLSSPREWGHLTIELDRERQRDPPPADLVNVKPEEVMSGLSGWGLEVGKQDGEAEVVARWQEAKGRWRGGGGEEFVCGF